MLMLTHSNSISFEDHIANGIDTLNSVIQCLEVHIRHFSEQKHADDLKILNETMVGATYLKTELEAISQDSENMLDFRDFLYIISHEFEDIPTTSSSPDNISIIRCSRVNIAIKNAIYYLHKGPETKGFFMRWLMGKNK